MALFNLLPEGETLEAVVMRECVTGFDVRFNRITCTAYEGDRMTEECAPHEAEFATVYAMTDIPGEAIAVHDAALNEAGADEIAQACRAIYVAMLRRDAPDAAQRHQAEQDAISSLY